MRTESTASSGVQRSRLSRFLHPETTIGRIGCAGAAAVWFLVLLLPIAMFWLAVQGTITIGSQGIPDAVDHPILEIRLIMDADYRGLQFKRSGIASQSETELCVWTDVAYLFWQNRSRQDQSVAYCDCYVRDESSSIWSLGSSVGGVCDA